MLFYSQKVIAFPVVTSKNFDDVIIMNNERPPAVKLRKWLMRNKESTLRGLMASFAYFEGLLCSKISAILLSSSLAIVSCKSEKRVAN